MVALLLAATLALPALASAQDTQAMDATKMGIDLDRIKRGLAETAEDDSGDPLRLRFRVEVVGIAPKIDFLEGFDVAGPLPYGAPTHREVLDVITPREFRTPVFPIAGLAMAAAQKLAEYGKKRECEAEIAEYRRLVMQGVAIAAPRCGR
jgi:hypothetical protein